MPANFPWWVSRQRVRCELRCRSRRTSRAARAVPAGAGSSTDLLVETTTLQHGITRPNRTGGHFVALPRAPSEVGRRVWDLRSCGGRT
jgi:hypothetical protein